MMKIIAACVLVGSAMFIAGCSNTGDTGQVKSLQSRLSAADRHVLVLRRDLTNERAILLFAMRGATEYVSNLKVAVMKLETELKDERPLL